MTSLNYDVLDLENIKEHPYCVHGPTVLFKNDKKAFYSCSACRDHKLCSFYALHDKKKPPSKEKMEIWHDIYLKSQISYEDKQKNYQLTIKAKSEDRQYCHTCKALIIKTNQSKHENHDLLIGLTDDMLESPLGKILTPVELNSANAQFIFSEKTIDFVLNHIHKYEYDSVLCIGTPSIFEALTREKFPNRFLLDIDERFIEFYDENKFSRYNMFNNHFFYGEKCFKEFLDKGKKMFVMIDPPYGGIVKLIANTINLIKKDYLADRDDRVITTFLIYPYFNETWIKTWLEDFNMLDYKVLYGNQKKFSEAIADKKGSPARIFTDFKNIDEIELPVDEGYVFCELCKKYTFKQNTHCSECNICPSKDGGFYKHCTECKKCVKISYKHCSACSHCHLPTENCEEETFSRKRKTTENESKNKTIKKKK